MLGASPTPLLALSMGLGRDSMTILALLQGPGVTVLGRRGVKLADLDAVIFSDTGLEWKHTMDLAPIVRRVCSRAGVPFFNLAKPPDREQLAYMKRWRKGVDQVGSWRTRKYFKGSRPTLREMQDKAARGGYHAFVDLDRASGLYERTTGFNTATCTERHKIVPVEEVLNDLLLLKYGISLDTWGVQVSRGELQPNVLMIGIAADETGRMRTWAPRPVAGLGRSLSAKRSKALLTWAVRKVYPLAEMGLTKDDEEEILAKTGWPFIYKSGCFSCHFQPVSWFWSNRLLDPKMFKRIVAYEKKAIDRQVRAGSLKVWTLKAENIKDEGLTLAQRVERWGNKPGSLTYQYNKGRLSEALVKAIRAKKPRWPRTGHTLAPEQLSKTLQRVLAADLLTKGYNRSCAAMDRDTRGDLNRRPRGRRYFYTNYWVATPRDREEAVVESMAKLLVDWPYGPDRRRSAVRFHLEHSHGIHDRRYDTQIYLDCIIEDAAKRSLVSLSYAPLRVTLTDKGTALAIERGWMDEPYRKPKSP